MLPPPTYTTYTVVSHYTLYYVVDNKSERFRFQSATLDDASAKDFKSEVGKPLRIGHIVQWCLISLGIVILIVCCIYAMIQYRKRREEVMYIVKYDHYCFKAGCTLKFY